MRRLIWMGLMVAGVSWGGMAQRAPLPAAMELLPRIYDYSERYRATLPSLSCDEAIVSQEVRRGVVKKEVRIVSTLREVRTGSGPKDFAEKHEFRTVNDAPAGGNVKIPYYVQGGFANAIGFTDRSKIGCYSYTVLRGEVEGEVRLEIEGKPDLADCREVPEGYRKTAMVDGETGRVRHVERTMSAGAAKRLKETNFASADYGQQTVGDGTLWLPVRMTMHDEKEEGRMTVTFSNYHRYTAHATISGEPVKEVPE